MDPLNGAGTLTQGWGANPQFPWQLGYGHLGCDWAAPVGTPIVSIADGTVLFADWGQNMPAGLANECMFIPGSPNNGICVVIQHDGWRSVHCHMNSTHLNTGDKVRRGGEIGRLGNTGNSTGPHVHGETWDRVPASNVPKFSRYNIMDQIRHEDAVAGVTLATAGRPANQRLVGPVAMSARTYPFQGAATGRAAAPHTWEVFTKWTRGENVILGTFQSDIWYGDADGWYWSGGFETQTGAGLPEISTRDVFPADYRLSGPAVAIQRSTPTARGAEVRKIQPYSVEHFSKVTRGEPVTVGTVSTDLWYGDSTGWVWAGMFTEHSVRGLTEIVPETVLAPNQRKVGPAGGNRRATPTADGTIVGAVKANDTEVFSHWTKGDPVTIGTVTSDIWYKDTLGYAWAGLFTEQKTAGLPEFAFVAGSTPPATGAYTFTKAFPMVTQVRPAARGNFEPGNFPAARDVANAYIHQFNAATPTENPTVNRETVHLSSVIATFQGSGRVASAHFGVEGTEVVQFVDLTDRAYAQGPGNADGWSVETYGAQDPVTVATAAKLIRELQRLTGGALKLRKHQEVMATACGNGIDLAKYRALVDTPQAVTPPPPITPQIPTPPPVVKETAESFLAKLRDQLNQWFTKK